MANNNEFVDELDELVRKHQMAAGITPTAPTTETPQMVDEPSPVMTETPTTNDTVNNDDDEYGDFDLDVEIAAEEYEDQRRREEAVQQAMENRPPEIQMPPNSLDKNFQYEAVDFQANQLALVTTMVNKVVAKHHLTTGGIPDEIRRKVMGELLECYYNDGEVITPEFEQIILNNWQNGPDTSDVPTNDESSSPQEVSQNVSEIAKPATINIDVQPDTPVVVNVDESVTSMLNSTNVVNIRVREVSSEEMNRMTVVENSPQTGIIEAFDSGLNDTPITLPLSGYRTTIRPINWFESLQMAAPTSHNQADFQLRKWSVIYNHMKNNSIGKFNTFDDFMRNTKYADGELLAWAVLVATADETENLTITCGNPKCRKKFIHKYQPRSIVHLIPERIPKEYREIGEVTPGPQAVALFEQIGKRRVRYQLPHTRIWVEFGEPSAYEHIQDRLPAIQELYTKYRPDDPSMDHYSDDMLQDPTMLEFSYKLACMSQITAMSVVRDNVEYRYTNWADIDHIICTALDRDDSGILLNLVGQLKNTTSPAEFYISDVTCPHCGRIEHKLPIDDIAANLLFQISRRLETMEINFIDMESN